MGMYVVIEGIKGLLMVLLFAAWSWEIRDERCEKSEEYEMLRDRSQQRKVQLSGRYQPDGFVTIETSM